MQFLPPFASAQTISTIYDFEEMLLDILDRLNYLFWLIAVAVFFWGVIKFISNADDATERQKGKNLIIWGIISFLVLLSIWGFVALILQDTFGIFSSAVVYVDKDGITY
jgi:cobalamin biosynthesis protein CobD/CbiB